MANLAESVHLSTEAVALFRLHCERKGEIDVDGSNREAYIELERAGLVLLGRPFVGEPRYHLTRKGFDRKVDILNCAKQSA